MLHLLAARRGFCGKHFYVMTQLLEQSRKYDLLGQDGDFGVRKQAAN